MGQCSSSSSSSSSHLSQLDHLPAKSEAASSSSDTLPDHPPQSAGDTTLSLLTKAKGHYWYPADGPRILDACGGAGVACLGHGRSDIARAAAAQMKSCAYVSYAHFRTRPVQELCEWLIESTGGEMQKVYLMNSGSEAVEAALKLAREYFVWKNEPQRVNYIGRWESYHGTTFGSLAASGHVVRRAPFEPLLAPQRFHKISACHAYRQRLCPEESDESFVARKAAELEAKFAELGGHTVAAVVLEPVVGAALGCVPAVPGYFAAVKKICDRHGALLVFDEVMCGMGRTGTGTGTTHAWQAREVGVVPDLQTIAKGFAGGYAPASALLVGRKVAALMRQTGRTFTHGHTYQDHPVVAATALKVQRVIERDGLRANVAVQGALLGRILKEKLGKHPNVGDVRGCGLFWGVEFVRDKTTKEPFDPALQVALRVFTRAVRVERVLVYHGQGCAGGGRGDHVMVMPAYDVSPKLVREMVERLARAVEDVFLGADGW
ncbi:putative aminotransferase YodT [Echria macrotheca]|uniref:Aminotransferase YodT n=1 Tax=Echria macrotheca TaxID=438768 RepID=A0AAJ0F617_9PEZI|nr:putative aminotransferase YodT [Echria macrotheca]